MKRVLIPVVLLCCLALVTACGERTPNRRPEADGVIISVDDSSVPTVMRVVHIEDPKKGVAPTKEDVTIVRIPADVQVLQMDGESYRKVDAALLKPMTTGSFWLKDVGTDDQGYRSGTAETVVYGGEYTEELPSDLP